MAKDKKKSKNGSLFFDIVELKLKIIDFLSPLAMVMLRVWVGLIFWKSGLSKISSMDSTIFLFAEEYKTHEKLTIFGGQILTPEITAYLATGAELLLPILLIAGIYTRGAAFFLLIMTAVIEFTYQSFPDHLVWAVVLGAILLNGAGRFSWDYFIRAKYFKFPTDDTEADKLLATFGTLCVTAYSAFLIFEGLIK